MQDNKEIVLKPTTLKDDVDKRHVEIELEQVELVSSKSDEIISQGGGNEGQSSSTIDEKRLIRRLDLTLMPWLGVLYLLCFLDRAGIGNARLYGMEDDLHLTDSQYLLCLSLFFIPYAFLEENARELMSKENEAVNMAVFNNAFMGPRHVTWKVVQGLVHNFAGLLAIRLLLGVFEAGFYAGSAFYFSCWYKRDELGFRLAVYNSAVTFAGAFGGLLAAAISNMDGVGGKPAWAWIFIIEGLVTFVVAIASFFLIQDYPDTARCLSEDERLFVIRRLQTDDQFSAVGERLRWRDVRKGIADWKTWLGASVIIGADGPLYAFSLFLPSIISQLGFTANRANLLTVPVYITACIFAGLVGYLADRCRRRGYISMGAFVITATGYIILLFSRHPALSYFATYVAAIGIFPAIPNAVTWVANNIEGSYKRSVSMGIAIGCGNLMGAFTSNTYRSRDAPWYTLGHAVTLIFIFIGLIGSIAFHFLLDAENKRRDQGERDEVIGNPENTSGKQANGCYESVEAAKMDKGDKWSGYRYIT